MDMTRLGLDLRFLRRHRGWTQQRVADAVGVARSSIAAIEGGHAERTTLALLLRAAAALGARVSVRVYWRGEALDRLRDERHAAIVERVLRLLMTQGWTVRTEVSFSKFGERGSIDVLALHPDSRALLVIEVKSVVPDLQAMLSNLDRKTRLAPGLVRTLGWELATVSRLLVLPEDRTARRRIAQHSTTFDAALPARNITVKRWLRRPTGAIAGLLFLSDVGRDDIRPTRRRSSPR
jgi:transcriptional regulator with XRE-family HTH domain